MTYRGQPMGKALQKLFELFFIPAIPPSPAEARRTLRDSAPLIDEAIKEAMVEGELSDIDHILAALDSTKSVIRRSAAGPSKAMHELLPSKYPNSEIMSIDLNWTKARFIHDYFKHFHRPSCAVVNLFMTSSGEVLAIMYSNTLGRVTAQCFPLVTATDAPRFIENLDSYVGSLSRSAPDFAALDKLLAHCGGTLIPHIVGCLYPDHLVFIPHRRLHFLPWHACFIEGAGGAKTFVADLTKSISFAPSVFDLVWTDFRPREIKGHGDVAGMTGDTDEQVEDQLPDDIKLVLKVIDISETANLDWAKLENRFESQMMKSGYPIDIIHRREELPHSFEKYQRISWSGHAKSSPNGWAESNIVLGTSKISASEIMSSWKLRRGSVVSLAACETAIDLSVPIDSDEYCGLDLAFRIAGATAVASTMWPVEDALAAFANLSLERYELQDETSTAESLSLLRKHLRSGEWWDYLATEEQMAAAPHLAGIRDAEIEVVREFRKLGRAAFADYTNWACWRCLSS